ncbi:hypothetical protein PP301_gp063 [Gordonia phage GMA2]|uniref:Uncharacterized protein n=1 Tax=Gordonia phage GMA2 TaxID=1647283 RepID=A0A0K0N6U8_9CAUD|nr:hypothetical protein PP301_gp063 [Gordonia phage GMA2]AKJ72659.1 hypothetical protein GMA2_121 [Gordonia phage GMA2]
MQTRACEELLVEWIDVDHTYQSIEVTGWLSASLILASLSKLGLSANVLSRKRVESKRWLFSSWKTEYRSEWRLVPMTALD